MNKLLSISIIFLCMIIALLSEVGAEPNKIPISVRVYGGDMCKPLIGSYIKRELRRIPDVVITEKTTPYLVVFVNCLPIKTKDNSSLGLAVSALFLQPLSDEIMEYLKAINTLRGGGSMQPQIRPSILVDQILENTSLDDLENSCLRIVATLDTEQIEVFRKMDMD